MKLFIIGNGFDLNHGYETGYKHFRKYLTSHSYPIYDFELSMYFNDLTEDLWSDFENQLEFIDFEDAMDFYVSEVNSDDSDREFERAISRNSDLQESFEEALNTLHAALCQALSNFVCKATQKKMQAKSYFSDDFGKNDIFITFNYTKVLENIYCIKSDNIKHIHGIAYPSYQDKDDVDIHYEEPTIIFGHGNTRIKAPVRHNYEYNPFNPQKCLKSLNQKLVKNYQKQALDNFLNNKYEKIDIVEIIGHNLGDVDRLYFDSLNRRIRKDVEIIFWVYDIDTAEKKKATLEEYFPDHRITLKDYPEE